MSRHAIGSALALAIAAAALAPLLAQSTAGRTRPAGESAAPATPQPAARKAGKYAVPHTPWGHPDLQGLWNNGTPTPLERPADLAGREFLSDEEWAARTKEAATRAEQRPKNAAQDVELAYDNEWWDRGTPLKRTSLIIDPADGKLPALTSDGQKLLADRAAAARRHGPADSHENRPLQERCLLYHGVPPFPTGYNNNYLIAQNRDFVALRYEMLAETRIIPLDARPHLGPRIPQWMGNSRGHWEGDTLVVETSDYDSKTTFRFPADYRTLRVVERFTRTADDAIDYQFTVNNPSMYTRPWTAVLPLARAPGPIYEYACHEGNHGLEHVLRGHRYEERQAEGASQTESK
jgi:hypothetical protein